MKIIYVDIDETICTSPSSRKYAEAIPIKENIEKINIGYTIKVILLFIGHQEAVASK
jgi:hypothetical protein